MIIIIKSTTIVFIITIIALSFLNSNTVATLLEAVAAMDAGATALRWIPSQESSQHIDAAKKAEVSLTMTNR